MIIALKITKADQEQAARLLPLLPQNEQVLLAMEEGVTGFDSPRPDSWKHLPWTDPYDSFPQTDNHVFQQIALYCKEFFKAPFLYLTAQTVPMRATWFEEITAAYLEAIKNRKPFMGALVRDQALRVNTMSPIGVYPPNISQLAGEMMLAHDEHWSLEGGAQIGPWFQKTPLIGYVTDGLNRTTAGDAALVGPDRDGKLFQAVYKRITLDLAHERVQDRLEELGESVGAALPKKGGAAFNEILAKSEIVPWQDLDESEQEIKRLCLKLRSFQTCPMFTSRVRMELCMFGVLPGDTRIKRMVIRRRRLGEEYLK